MNGFLDAIAENYRNYTKVSDLQAEFMEKHEKLAPDFVRVEYSNGTIIVINYGTQARIFDGKTIASQSFLRIDQKTVRK